MRLAASYRQLAEVTRIAAERTEDPQSKAALEGVYAEYLEDIKRAEFAESGLRPLPSRRSSASASLPPSERPE